MCKIFWLPLITFMLKTDSLAQNKPSNYPYVTVEIAKLAVENGYPVLSTCLGKAGTEFYPDLIILTYQELIDWLREKKGLYMNVQITTDCVGPQWIWSIYNIRTGMLVNAPLFGKNSTYYEAQNIGLKMVFERLNRNKDETSDN